MNWVWPIAPAQEPFICAGRDVAILQNLQRGEQFVLEIVAAIMGVGEGRQRANHIVRAGESAEIGLQSPDADDHGRVDAEFLFALASHGSILPRRRLGALDALGRHRGGEIFPYRLDEFGLRLVWATTLGS